MRLTTRSATPAYHELEVGEFDILHIYVAGTRISVLERNDAGEPYADVHIDPVGRDFISRLATREVSAHDGQVIVRTRGRREP